jgi:hypothetical protein
MKGLRDVINYCNGRRKELTGCGAIAHHLSGAALAPIYEKKV